MTPRDFCHRLWQISAAQIFHSLCEQKGVRTQFSRGDSRFGDGCWGDARGDATLGELRYGSFRKTRFVRLVSYGAFCDERPRIHTIGRGFIGTLCLKNETIDGGSQRHRSRDPGRVPMRLIDPRKRIPLFRSRRNQDEVRIDHLSDFHGYQGSILRFPSNHRILAILQNRASLEYG